MRSARGKQRCKRGGNSTDNPSNRDLADLLYDKRKPGCTGPYGARQLFDWAEDRHGTSLDQYGVVSRAFPQSRSLQRVSRSVCPGSLSPTESTAARSSSSTLRHERDITKSTRRGGETHRHHVAQCRNAEARSGQDISRNQYRWTFISPTSSKEKRSGFKFVEANTTSTGDKLYG